MYLPTYMVSLPSGPDLFIVVSLPVHKQNENVWAKEGIALRDLTLSTRWRSGVASCPSHVTLDAH
jgi:hypothetical protein